MNKRGLITGGAGFLGSRLADEALAHGYQVMFWMGSPHEYTA